MMTEIENQYPKSVSGVCQLIWDMEDRLKLLERTENGVYYWQLLRFNIYYELMQKIDVFGAPHPAPPLSLSSALKTMGHFLKSLTVRNPYFVRGTRRYIVFPHTRQIQGVDIYSKAQSDSLPAQETLFLYRAWKGAHYPNSCNMGQTQLAVRALSFLQSKFTRQKLSDENASILGEVRALIAKHYGLDIELEKRALRHIRLFKLMTSCYTKLFAGLKTEELFVVIGYTNYPAIAAAQSLGITVTELQHGTFTKYHLGYSYPVQSGIIPYFPDQLNCFGQYWPETTPLPEGTKIEIIGAPYIRKLSIAEKSSCVRKRSIVFSSQGVISKYMYDFALKASELLPEYRIIYRLHPSEKAEDFEYGPKPSNFEISSKTPDIFSLLRECEYQAGVFSTTLLEGMSLGCKTILINMPGIEYMYPIIEKGDVILVDSPEEFAEKLPDAGYCTDPDYYYA